MIKLFAIVFMFLDHFALILLPSQSGLYWGLRLLGRLSMPLYAYCIARGCFFSVKKGSFYAYLKNILILALVSQIPFSLIYEAGIFGGGLNICFSWYLSAFFIGSFLCKENRLKFSRGMLLFAVVAWIIVVIYLFYIGLDYGFMGVFVPITMFVCYRRCFEGKTKEPLPVAVLVIAVLWAEFNYIECYGKQLPQLLMVLSIPLISFLSPFDNKVKVSKLIGYLCYPLSIVPFLLMRYILNL